MTDGPRKPQVAVEIDGREVRIIIMHRDCYAAIEMYEELVADARTGSLFFSLVTKR